MDNTRQVAIAGWYSDICRWRHIWYNEFGGFGEVQWNQGYHSYEKLEGLLKICDIALETIALNGSK